MKLNAEELRQLDACDEGLEKFVAAHGEQTVSIVDAFDSNGLDDVCWYLGKITLTKDQERDLRLFACDCTERVLPIYEAEYPDDDRPRRAVEVSRAYALGETTKEELDAAAYAARDAARDASWYAARAAAGVSTTWVVLVARAALAALATDAAGAVQIAAEAAEAAAEGKSAHEQAFRQMLVKWVEGKS